MVAEWLGRPQEHRPSASGSEVDGHVRWHSDAAQVTRRETLTQTSNQQEHSMSPRHEAWPTVQVNAGSASLCVLALALAMGWPLAASAQKAGAEIQKSAPDAQATGAAAQTGLPEGQKGLPPGMTMAPHRAVYEIALVETRGGGGVSDLSGRMVYELTGSVCQGYTQTMRFVTRMTSQDGSTSLTDMRSSSWEDALAKAFRFNSSQYKDTKLEETTDGDAARSGPKGEVKVEITKPRKKALNLKGNTFFPIQHSMALLSAAQKGDHIFIADLYDGSEKGEKVYATSSFIGRVKPAGFNSTLSKVPSAEPLDKIRSWPVSISYFEEGSDLKDAVPSYELAFIYFENGVSRRLFIDYGEFAVRGTLQKLDFLPPAKCKG